MGAERILKSDLFLTREGSLVNVFTVIGQIWLINIHHQGRCRSDKKGKKKVFYKSDQRLAIHTVSLLFIATYAFSHT